MVVETAEVIAKMGTLVVTESVAKSVGVISVEVKSVVNPVNEVAVNVDMKIADKVVVAKFRAQMEL
ncbi:hypothetical protein HDU97_006880 [Phlyctochytrium planicorne]|nr:hypothetical protein HDU97_006880 [Phlyctochytrium planicorne]